MQAFRSLLPNFKYLLQRFFLKGPQPLLCRTRGPWPTSVNETLFSGNAEVAYAPATHVWFSTKVFRWPTGQDDRTSRRVASVMSERTRKLFLQLSLPVQAKRLQQVLLRCFRDAIRVPRVENQVPWIREIGSLESEKSGPYRVPNIFLKNRLQYQFTKCCWDPAKSRTPDREGRTTTTPQADKKVTWSMLIQKRHITVVRLCRGIRRKTTLNIFIVSGFFHARPMFVIRCESFLTLFEQNVVCKLWNHHVIHSPFSSATQPSNSTPPAKYCRPRNCMWPAKFYELYRVHARGNLRQVHGSLCTRQFTPIKSYLIGSVNLQPL